jgi:hypothetical protein
MDSINLTNSSLKNKRRSLDFYPTPPTVTWALLNFLNLPLNYLIWEPACGTMEMVNVIREYGYKCYATDIISGTDFLKTSSEGVKFDAIITNPPFAESENFIKHAIALAPTVAMLVKSQYWHSKKRSVLFESNPPTYILPLTWRPDFMNGERGGAPTMEVLWTVWIRGVTDTRYRLLHKENK